MSWDSFNNLITFITFETTPANYFRLNDMLRNNKESLHIIWWSSVDFYNFAANTNSYSVIFDSLNNMITPMIVIIAAISPLASTILTPFHLDMKCLRVCSDLSCSPFSAMSDCQSPEMLSQEWSILNYLSSVSSLFIRSQELEFCLGALSTSTFCTEKGS